MEDRKIPEFVLGESVEPNIEEKLEVKTFSNNLDLSPDLNEYFRNRGIDPNTVEIIDYV